MIVGIDDGKQLRVELVQELGNRLARRLACVAPSLEGDKGDGILEDRAIEPLQEPIAPTYSPCRARRSDVDQGGNA